MYLEELIRINERLKLINEQLQELLKEVPESKYILSIPGVGKVTAAVFFGEIGNLSNFNNYREVVKYAGYDPVGRDSGQRISRKWISKKGRHLLRKFLYYMSMRVIYRSNYFNGLYEIKKNTQNKYNEKLKKKEALCAVVIKLIKVIFTLIRERREFSEEIPKRVAVAA